MFARTEAERVIADLRNQVDSLHAQQRPANPEVFSLTPGATQVVPAPTAGTLRQVSSSATQGPVQVGHGEGSPMAWTEEESLVRRLKEEVSSLQTRTAEEESSALRRVEEASLMRLRSEEASFGVMHYEPPLAPRVTNRLMRPSPLPMAQYLPREDGRWRGGMQGPRPSGPYPPLGSAYRPIPPLDLFEVGGGPGGIAAGGRWPAVRAQQLERE